MPRSFMAQIPSSSKWLHVIVKPETVAVQWKEWTAKSRKDAYERLQFEHEKLRYFPGMRASVCTNPVTREMFNVMKFLRRCL